MGHKYRYSLIPTMTFGALVHLAIFLYYRGSRVGRSRGMTINYGHVVVRGAAPYVLSE